MYMLKSIYGCFENKSGFLFYFLFKINLIRNISF